MSVLMRALNMPGWVSHWLKHRKNAGVWNPADDLELQLYQSIFGNNFLHYGYFANPPASGEEISLAQIKQAMDDYAQLLVARVQANEHVLDVGCGTGGLLTKLKAKGVHAVGLTPNLRHADHIESFMPGQKVVRSGFEAATPQLAGAPFDAVINSESFQYIDLHQGMQNVRAMLKPGGRWLVIDYFRLTTSAKNKSGHMLAEFDAALKQHGFTVTEEVDVNENVLPCLAYAKTLVERVALPMVRFSSDKFFLSHPVADYIFKPALKTKLDGIKMDTLDAEVFRREKRYKLYVLGA
jgi:cyclopropane fatty-acyl-phospholipid synthase-like methyltransferase